MCHLPTVRPFTPRYTYNITPSLTTSSSSVFSTHSVALLKNMSNGWSALTPFMMLRLQKMSCPNTKYGISCNANGRIIKMYVRTPPPHPSNETDCVSSQVSFLITGVEWMALCWVFSAGWMVCRKCMCGNQIPCFPVYVCSLHNSTWFCFLVACRTTL